MTEEKKNEIIADIEKLTKDYFLSLKQILMNNDLRYCAKYSEFYAIAFPNGVPEIDNGMLEDLCFDIADHSDCVADSLFEKSYIEKIVAEREERDSPKNRILEHMSEIKRLKEKYNITDDDLKKTI